MKKQIEVKLNGLNELGVQEINKFYKHNIEEYNWEPFKLGDKFGLTKKRFKNSNEFYKNGLDTYISFFDTKQHIPNSNLPGNYFDFLLKHFVHEIFEVEVIETKTKITL
jgi:hypothetical protein